MKGKLGLVCVILLFAATACGGSNGSASGAYTGFLEGNTLDIAPEAGGRITSIQVSEGDVVSKGQKLLTIEDDIPRLKIASADATVEAAQAQLALLEAGARPEDLRQAQAKVDQARAGLDAATQAVADAEAIRANPQMLLIAKAQADASAGATAQQLIAAADQAAAADLVYQMWTQQVQMLQQGFDVQFPGGGGRHFDTPSLKLTYAREEWGKAGITRWQAWAAASQAQANSNKALAAQKDISDQLTNPIALDTNVNQARAARDRAAANLQAAEAGLQTLKEGASSAQIQAAQSALDQARAARASLDQELSHYQIMAPSAGTVTNVYNKSGEVISPTAPVIRLSVPGDLTLRVFVAMGTLDKVQLGKTMPVQVEGIQDRTFTGTVNRIADSAEFSSRQAQTDSERNAQLVAVEILIRNPDGVLKSGMPASVSF